MIGDESAPTVRCVAHRRPSPGSGAATDGSVCQFYRSWSVKRFQCRPSTSSAARRLLSLAPADPVPDIEAMLAKRRLRRRYGSAAAGSGKISPELSSIGETFSQCNRIGPRLAHDSAKIALE